MNTTLNRDQAGASLCALAGTRTAIRERSARYLACAALIAAGMTGSPALADTYAVTCGAPIKSLVKTHYNDEFSSTSTSFVNVPQAVVVINVPSGQTQCVKVRFSAVLICETPSSSQSCFMKVTDSTGYLWAPASASYSSDSRAAAHSFEWVARLSAGSHALRMAAAAGSGSKVTVTNWTLVAEVAK